MFKFLCAVLLLSVSIAASADVGFTKGSRFQVSQLLGQVTVICAADGSGDSGVASGDCALSLLEPAQSDYFQGPDGVMADEVVLTAIHDDQTSRSKDSGYNSKKGRSTSDFNLWISTLLQRPLLKEGRNVIQYSMFLKKQQVTSGEFIVNVDGAPTRYCNPRTYSSTNGSECRNPTLLCNRYFYEENYCR
jgi:hypothetical protein